MIDTSERHIMKEMISNNVYALRTCIGLTQEEFGNRIGVSRQTVIAIEKGNYTPSVLLALRIAKVCNEPVEKIFKIIYEK
jgi:putative transcriptional regulator